MDRCQIVWSAFDFPLRIRGWWGGGGVGVGDAFAIVNTREIKTCRSRPADGLLWEPPPLFPHSSSGVGSALKTADDKVLDLKEKTDNLVNVDKTTFRSMPNALFVSRYRSVLNNNQPVEVAAVIKSEKIMNMHSDLIDVSILNRNFGRRSERTDRNVEFLTTGSFQNKLLLKREFSHGVTANSFYQKSIRFLVSARVASDPSVVI